MQFRFIHAADLHLDSPLRGLERHEGAPVEQLRGATRQAFGNLIELCIDEQVALLLIAGDLYDGDWKDFNTGLRFVSGMVRLREAGVRVAIVRGNHDAQSVITRSLELPDNVKVFSDSEVETWLLDDLGVAVHGQSYATRAVTEDLATAYPTAIPGLLNLAVLHTCASGRPGHAPYAPCGLETLLAKRHDYWALGHVHTREVLHQRPWVVFSGNLQGRNVREQGAKGCTLVTVADGEITAVEHRPVDVVRWSDCTIDVSAATLPEEAVACVRRRLNAELRATGGLLLAVRLHLVGATAAHAELQERAEHWRSEVLAAALDEGGGDIWIERVTFATRMPLEIDVLRARDDALGSFLRGVAALRTDAAGLRDLATALEPLVGKLPAALREEEGGLDLQDAGVLADMLGDLEQLLLPRLWSAKESE